MKRFLLMAVVAAGLLACSQKSATGPVTKPPPDSTPALKDPTVDLYNNSPNRVYFTWRNGASVLGADTVPANTHRCEAFTAVADSAFWQVLDTSTASGNWAEQHTNYFDPTTRPAWNVAVSEQSGSIIIIAKDTTAECTP